MAHRRFNIEATLVAGTVLVMGCQPTTPPSAGGGEALQTLIDRVVADNELVRAAAVHLDSPVLGLDWSGAAGLADPESGDDMTADRPVRGAGDGGRWGRC